jgi:hypothetical protein
MEVGVIGAGTVGGESVCDLDAAARVLPRDSAREPDARTRAAGVVTDIGPGRPLSPPVDVVDGNYDDLAGADLVMADHEHVFGTRTLIEQHHYQQRALGPTSPGSGHGCFGRA